jgi:DNA polymerase III epsilon subunit-like protein
MIIVDVETTGTDPRVHSLLSIGAIDFNNPENRFSEECRMFEGAKIEKEATLINGIDEKQATDPSKQSDKELIEHFFQWMEKASDHTIAGQNPHFDTSFLEATARRYHMNFSIPKRIIDLHTATWTHRILNKKEIPITHKRSDINSDFIMNYVGLTAEPHPHIAINGALYEAEAFSRLFFDKPLLKEFESFQIPWLN